MKLINQILIGARRDILRNALVGSAFLFAIGTAVAIGDGQVAADHNTYGATNGCKTEYFMTLDAQLVNMTCQSGSASLRCYRFGTNIEAFMVTRYGTTTTNGEVITCDQVGAPTGVPPLGPDCTNVFDQKTYTGSAGVPTS